MNQTASQATLVGPVIAAVVAVLAAAATWIRSIQIQRQQQRANIESALNKAIELAITYPHLGLGLVSMVIANLR